MDLDSREAAGLPATYDWAVATGGKLTDLQRRAMRRAVYRQYGTFVAGLVSSPFRRGRSREPFQAARPDSRLARLGDEAAATQPPELIAHGYRTWMLGAALADQDGVELDPEQFYVAAILHDAGLTQALLGEDFTIRSAQTALGVCDESGACSEAARTAIADAIVAHITPGIEPELHTLGYYVQLGAAADLSGFRFWDMAKGQIRQAYSAHPSADVHRKIAAMVKVESDMSPGGRARVLIGAGFGHVVKYSLLRHL